MSPLIIWNRHQRIVMKIAQTGRIPTRCSPSQTVESFNARMRDELLNGEIFYSLKEAQIVIEGWRQHYNTVRPHASLGYRPPAPEVFVPGLAAWPTARFEGAPTPTLGLAQRPTMN